jgi:CheY-like chemotaxis protein
MTEPAASQLATVLVVDDDVDWRQLLRESLEKAGYRVIEAPRGDVALTSVEQQRPDVVVLDHHMPGLNGLDVTARLRTRWPLLPIVLMSAFGDAHVMERAHELGVTRYLDKPFPISTLVEQIGRLSSP